MKSNQNQIKAFLAQKELGIVGASRNPKKFGNEVLRQLLKLEYSLTPVHHEADTIEGLTCVRSISDLPDGIQAVCLITPKDKTDELLKQALAKGINHIWIQQFSEGPETHDLIKGSQANIVTGRCMFMYTNPQGFHKFHEQMAKLFKVYAN
jgi:uncharacterized protein